MPHIADIIGMTFLVLGFTLLIISMVLSFTIGNTGDFLFAKVISFYLTRIQMNNCSKSQEQESHDHGKAKVEKSIVLGIIRGL